MPIILEIIATCVTVVTHVAIYTDISVLPCLLFLRLSFPYIIYFHCIVFSLYCYIFIALLYFVVFSLYC